VLAAEGTAPCTLNAANEVAVEKFLAGKIKFTHIPEIINKALNHINNQKSPDLETIIECDRLSRNYVRNIF
jgi:1-deoxy-D-xylulose-5-phosphate reductoisomerase